MESITAERLSFTYPGRQESALREITISIGSGEFAVICGKSGSGKTTLLRMMKPALSPAGSCDGIICIDGKPVSELSFRAQSEKIGFVMQNPEAQLVTDRVWHEMAFGAENLGMASDEIRGRIAETASYFGIQSWFHKKTSELSGGQKQILNLASVMVTRPEIILLDEPTGSLDPIAAKEFIGMLIKINRELGTTIIMSEHRPEEVMDFCSRVIVMEEGRIAADGTPREVGKNLFLKKSYMFAAMPVAMRVFAEAGGKGDFPVSIREGRNWLKDTVSRGKECDDSRKSIRQNSSPEDSSYFADGSQSCGRPLAGRIEAAVNTGDAGTLRVNGNTGRVKKGKPERKNSEAGIAVKIDRVRFRYEKDLPDVLNNLSLEINKGEIYSVLGGNGTGKTTALSVIMGSRKPYRGKVFIGNGLTAAMLPQEVKAVFSEKTVEGDLMEMLRGGNLSRTEKDTLLADTVKLCELQNVLKFHPYDLSGGEQQRAALAKIMLTSPDIVLLDEPTTGLDACYKSKLGGILRQMSEKGTTVVMVSHDIEFCAEYSHRCGLMFDGCIVSEGTPREFFCSKDFYTTAAHRMAVNILPDVLNSRDIAVKLTEAPGNDSMDNGSENDGPGCVRNRPDGPEDDVHGNESEDGRGSINCRKYDGYDLGNEKKSGDNTEIRSSKRILLKAAAFFVAIPLTVILGSIVFDDRKYYFISLLIIIEAFIPMAAGFERRKPGIKEIMMLSVMCGIAVAGRVAFYMIPQFKPMAAIVIIAGICFGAEKGFMTGALSALISNFFFGQGPWTPWQMIAFGLVGLAAGLIFAGHPERVRRIPVSIFGILSVLIIYGVTVNLSSVLMFQNNFVPGMFISAIALGLPFDAIHAISTGIFLFLLAKPMQEKIFRVMIKYDIK